MQRRSRALVWVVVVMVTVLAGLGGCKKRRDTPPADDARPTGPDTTDKIVPPAAVRHVGLGPDDAKTFYSLSEGSELFPLTWMFNMDSTATGKPFVEDLGRFGLIFPDEKKDPWGLPIGITVHEPEDFRILDGVKMVGVNCAACHVGEIVVNGKRLRIDGAPNQFDIQKFYNELIDSAVAVLEDKDRRKLIRMLFGGLDGKTIDLEAFGGAASDPALAASLDNVQTTLAEPEKLRAEGGAGKKIVDEIDRIVADEAKRFDADLKRYPDELVGALLMGTGDPGRPGPVPPTPPGQPKFGGLDLPTLNRDAIIGDRAKDILDEALGMVTWATSLRARIRLLKARIAFLQSVAHKKTDDTSPLDGRVDAFGFARNFLFGATYGYANNTAPISYPHLWGIEDTAWLHWNANTNSVMARNIGQALGVGAIVHVGKKDKYLSSVLVENIHQLETLAYKLKAPRWAELQPAVLPAINAELAKQGAALYKAQCAGCHDVHTVENGLKVYPLTEFKDLAPEQCTDQNQAKNFAAPLGANGPAFTTELSTLLAGVEEEYVARHKITPTVRLAWNAGRDPVIWRAPLGYPARPLAGTWATSPYLHNNSVPTLYQLLKPPAERPTKFVVGGRDFDPVEVGYVYTLGQPPADTSRVFDTTLPGNSNVGHNHFTGTDDERKALVEYLKTL